MAASIIDGKKIAHTLCEQLTEFIAHLQQVYAKTPGLAVVLVGDDPASAVYVKNKLLKAKQTGIASYDFRLPESAQEKDLLQLISQLNAREDIHGILVQLPLPAAITQDTVIHAIDPQKDVDGLHPFNAGLLASAAVGSLPDVVPCTPLGCLMLIRLVLGRSSFAGLEAVVVGRSSLVGRPMATLLCLSDATVTQAHSKTPNLAEVTKRADILVTAVGKREFLTGEHVKEGALVIDVGINKGMEGGLLGDVHFASVAQVASAVTPVPGGVGPMTIACLTHNTVRAFCKQENIPFDFQFQFSHSWKKFP